MEQTENEMVLSVADLWSIVDNYVDHLHYHNQTAKLRQLFSLLDFHKEYYGRELEPVLDMMSKYGMHEFTENGSHFKEPMSAQCGPNFTSVFEVNLIRTTEYW
jgi:hypothetical protein